MSNYWRKIKDGSHKAGSHFSKACQRLSDRRICIGVTGFSRSGKTTFITSLLHQLRHHTSINLSAFSPVIQGRLLGADWCSLENSRSLFPYEPGIKRLSSDKPQWPLPTDNESSCLLEIRLKQRNSLLRLSNKSYDRILVEIRDYPGEWLIDIPMLGMTYRQWCHHWMNLVKSVSRQKMVQEYLSKALNVDPLSPFSEIQFNELYAAFHNFNSACREAGLTLIQPGQLLLKPEAGQGPEPFLPLPAIDRLALVGQESPAETSWICQLQRRYDSYVKSRVKPFIARSVEGVDRQLVLVDVVTSLSQGSGALDDVQQALIQVLQTFSYGRNNLLSKMIKPSIERLSVVATKVDQVLPGQHDNIRRLTSILVGSAYRQAAFCNIPVSCEAIASVRSSTVTRRQGHERLAGTTMDGTYGEMWHPDIPARLPTAEDWRSLAGWKPRQLLPPHGMLLLQGGALPHIRLDVVIENLIGDLCS